MEIFGIKFIRCSHHGGKSHFHTELVGGYVLVWRACLQCDLGCNVLYAFAWISQTGEGQFGAEYSGRKGPIITIIIIRTKFAIRKLMSMIWFLGYQEIQLDYERD